MLHSLLHFHGRIVPKGRGYLGITFPIQMGRFCCRFQETWVGERFKSFRKVQREMLEICGNAAVLVVNEMCQTRRGDLLHGFRTLQLPAFLLSLLTFSFVTSFFILSPSFVMH